MTPREFGKACARIRKSEGMDFEFSHLGVSVCVENENGQFITHAWLEDNKDGNDLAYFGMDYDKVPELYEEIFKIINANSCFKRK